MAQKEEILQKGEQAAKNVSRIVFLMAGLKLLIGFFSHSVALISDALHSVGDAFSILFVWFGFVVSQRKPTDRFPYGFYKAESLVSLLVSFFILYAGFEIGQESYQRISSPSQLSLPLLAIGISLIDALVIYFLGRYELKIGKEINSQSLIADGKESKLHIVSSLLVVGGIASSYFGIPRVEGVVGIIFSLLVFKIGIESLKDAVFALMDVSPSKGIEEKIKQALRSQGEVKEFSSLRLRSSGPFIFGEVNIRIKKFLEVKRAHEIADELEEKVKKEVPQVESLIVHVEPFKGKTKKIVIPVKERKGLDSPLDERFGRANLFLMLFVEEKKIKSHQYIENPFQEKELRAGLAVADYLSEKGPDILITSEIGPISFHTLRDKLIDVYEAKGETVKEAVDNFLAGKMKRFKEPTKEKV
ncbi:MAG: cation diffusion facilitator family transporter [Candidatus Nealsonbacteria bacterium]|nr:cation diffusion facilitator family transporter [Candidatus Nealsonbacteria bacterium]